MTDGQDLMRQIASAGARIDPALSDRDVERLVAAARHRRRRRVAGRLIAGAAVVAAGVFVIGMLGRVLEPVPRPLAVLPHAPVPPAGAGSAAAPASVRPSADRVLHLADGSSATPLDATAEIALTHESARHVGLALGRGRGRFAVTPNPARSFAVRAGDVTVTVMGTVFTVERIADRVGVAVERGKVRVDWGAGSALLVAGESGWYPPLGGGVPAAPKVHVPPAKAPRQNLPPSTPARPAPAAAAPAPETAEQLLLAADRERLAGRAERGAELLRTLLREHRDDARAPLAAFTLGRVLLMELGRPGEAAAAFAEVRRLAPGGPFAEDALAREVEALSKAGQAARAHERALEYLHVYPSGRRAAAVRAMGGSE